MERASNTLQRIMAEALRRVPAEQLPEAAWEFCAGRAVAEKTRVLGCEKNSDKGGDSVGDSGGERVTLLVEVPDANWRAQLYSMTPQLLARLNQFIKISRIEFKLARPQDERRGK
jgi:hypothetical protein